MNGEKIDTRTLRAAKHSGMTPSVVMNGNGVVFWLEENQVKYGALVGWKWLPCELAAAEVITPYGTRLDVLAEDVFLSRGEAMKELAAQAGI